MEENTNINWLEVFKANYNGETEEAKSIEEYIKNTYNGAKYVPWATMERLTYMQDPKATFETMTNENGGLVWTDGFTNKNRMVAKDGSTTETEALVVSHFVKVSCTFLGKHFVEEYPIQDQDYSAAKIYNQNLVNKAIKRAMAKVASRATGIGLKLYENKDLQFEDDMEETKPEVKKSTRTKKTETQEQPKVELVKTEQPRVEMTEEQKVANILDGGETEAYLNGERTFEPQEVKEEITIPREIFELINLIKTEDKEKMTRVLQNLNVAILKQHGFTLSVEDSEEDLAKKLSAFKDVTIFTKAIKNMLN